MSEIKIETASAGGGGGGSGTVTSVALTIGTAGTDVNRTGSPITTSGTFTLNIPVASALNTGKLSNTDWSTFNNKQAALVSGTNIKSLFSTSLLGPGNLVLTDWFGNTLKNFVPTVASGGVLTINSGNQDTYNTGIYKVTGAVNITIDSTVRQGFSLTVFQVDANQCTFVGAGSAVLVNRQGHTQSAGQFAVCSLFYSGTDLILTGDTA
jgi:hypothetical protein